MYLQVNIKIFVLNKLTVWTNNCEKEGNDTINILTNDIVL